MCWITLENSNGPHRSGSGGAKILLMLSSPEKYPGYIIMGNNYQNTPDFMEASFFSGNM